MWENAGRYTVIREAILERQAMSVAESSAMHDLDEAQVPCKGRDKIISSERILESKKLLNSQLKISFRSMT